MTAKVFITHPGDVLQFEQNLLIDVRSPKEYSHSHIPGAINLPLLNDEERHIVGLTYKEKGSEKAVEKGFELVGGKFADYIREARAIAQKRDIVVYCWRGGMRSNIMAWVLGMAGLPVSLIEGGYKQFRRTVLNDLEKPRTWVVVSGKTGTGKTEILHELAALGENVLDLENLAHHKGSAFGGLGQAKQPSMEQFENKIALSLSTLNEGIIWVEDESRWIGGIKIPDVMYTAIRSAKTLAIFRDDIIRKKRILDEYGIFPKEQLADRTSQLQKRLGGDRTKLALERLDSGDLPGWLDILMPYYDTMYDYGLNLRQKELVTHVETTASDDTETIAKLLLKYKP